MSIIADINVTERAEQIGREHGKSAATWAEIDSTNAATILAGIDDGDPAVLDMFRTPDLSGEFAGDYLSCDLASDLGIEDSDDLDDVCRAYLDAASEAFWDAIESTCLAVVEGNTAEQLKRAGFTVSYANREDVSNGTLPPYGHYFHASRSAGLSAYVDLGNVARGEDAAGQASYVDRSNFRRLTVDYPTAFTPIGYVNVDSLGAFVADLDGDLVDVLCGLATDYPVYDEDDMSTLEQDTITEEWADFAASDFGRELPEDAEEAWDALSESEQAEMFWSACEEAGQYPEAASVEILWSYAYERAAPIVARMLAERSG
jgi:hypothetical protein